MKERMSEGIFSFKFFTLFLNVFMIGAMYIAEMIGESAEPWSTPTLVLKDGEEKLFHVYVVERLAW